MSAALQGAGSIALEGIQRPRNIVPTLLGSVPCPTDLGVDAASAKVIPPHTARRQNGWVLAWVCTCGC